MRPLATGQGGERQESRCRGGSEGRVETHDASKKSSGFEAGKYSLL